MKCAYSKCNKEVSDLLPRNTKYHTHTCYKMEKRDRDKREYHRRKNKYRVYERNQEILGCLEKMQKPILKTVFFEFGFNWLWYDKVHNGTTELIFWFGSFKLSAEKIYSPSSIKPKLSPFIITRPI